MRSVFSLADSYASLNVIACVVGEKKKIAKINKEKKTPILRTSVSLDHVIGKLLLKALTCRL